MSHAHAALTPRARLKLARLVVEDGWPVARAAERYEAVGDLLPEPPGRRRGDVPVVHGSAHDERLDPRPTGCTTCMDATSYSVRDPRHTRVVIGRLHRARPRPAPGDEIPDADPRYGPRPVGGRRRGISRRLGDVLVELRDPRCATSGRGSSRRTCGGDDQTWRTRPPGQQVVEPALHRGRPMEI